MAQANKHVLMAALTYNLKKLMKFNRPKASAISVAMKKINKSIGKAIQYVTSLNTNYVTAQ